MKRKLLTMIAAVALAGFGWAQPNDCDEAVQGCTTPSFHIDPPNDATNNFDFGTGTVSNPSTNPNGTNSGCLLSGETSSTFITITVVSDGTLEWSIQGTMTGCFDWIMWPYTFPAGAGDSPTCAMLQNDQLPPVACNWNGACLGFTGMAGSGNLPAGADWSDFENALNVTAGQNFLLCLSNYSSTSQDVELDFFGTAAVVCGVSAPDQTICEGSSATVNIATPGLVNPTFQWLVTTGVSDPTSGTNVIVTPTATTTYSVQVSQAATPSTPSFVDTAVFTITVVSPPAPNAGADDTVCLGMPINLSGSVASASNTRSWATVTAGISPPPTVNFSPNFQSLTPTVTVNQPGLYRFVLRESNGPCGMARDTVSVLVVDPVVSASNIPPTCGGYADGQITLTATNAASYSYDGGATWVPNATMGGFTAGTYNVCMMTPEGCSACTTTTLIDPPTVLVSAFNDTLICQNGIASLSAVGSVGTTFVYHWSHTTDLAANQTASPTVDTWYSVRAESETGCLSQPDSVLVSVRAPIVAVMAPADTVCPLTLGTVSVVSVSGGLGVPYNFVWSNGHSESGAISSLVDNPASTTSYTVTVTDGCESSPHLNSQQIITAPVPDVSIATDEDELCEPARFTVWSTTDPNMTAGTHWTVSPNQGFDNMDTIRPKPLDAGNYDIELVVTTPDGCIVRETFPGFLHVKPVPEAMFKWNPDPVMMFNTNVRFANLSTGADSYSWTFEGGSPGTSSEDDPSTLYPDGIAASYTVTLVAYSNLGCQDTLVREVIVSPEVLLYAPNTFTPDDNSYNQTWRVYVDGIDEADFELLVYDRWGQVVWKTNDVNAEWDGKYRGDVLPSGMYNWTIVTRNRLTGERYRYTGYLNLLK